MFDYLWSVWRAVQLGLQLQPNVVQIAAASPNASWVAFGVVMAGGISLLLGQSVILFANQVSLGRFFLSLATNGLLHVTGWAIWSSIVWFIGIWLFDQKPHFVLVLRLVALSYAPLVFGFLILMPYAGPFVQRLLYTWSFLIALGAVAYTFQVGFIAALLCVGLGWLLLMLLTATIGRPMVALRNWIWHRLTGTSIDASVEEVMQQFAIEQASRMAQRPPGSKDKKP